MARVPQFVHTLSRSVMSAIASTEFGRATTEKLLRSYYPRAQSHGIGSVAVPLWYQWLRAYYFAALRRRLNNDEFQRTYWEIGSLTDYRRYVVEEAADERIQRFVELIAVQARKLTKPNQQLRVLEVGCGTGLPLQLLREALGNPAELSLSGFDISMNALLLARRSLGRGASLIQASVTALPFGHRFDLACCRGVLMFLDEAMVSAAFKELARTCGMLVLAEPSNVRGELVESDDLVTSIRRDGLDQTSWIHPYRRLAVESGASVISKELVAGNLLLVLDWTAHRP